MTWLIASLGTSPSVLTEAIWHLEVEKQIPVDRLTCVGTRSSWQKAQRELFQPGGAFERLRVHLGKPAFEQYGGGVWDYDKAWALLQDNVNMDEASLRFELNRYMGWPGQAISYKVGQRLWEQIRAEASAQASARGEEFSLRDFHSRALKLGSVPLSVLRDALVS